jgi:bis(5'-nucleosidyl)-tetraphosphatase
MTMAAPVPARRFSAGVVVVHGAHAAVQYLLLRAYKNWDFPKGLVEPGEQPLAAAMREVKEETTLENLCFDWGESYIDTGPYNKGKISRYYIARSDNTQVHLPINPELGFPEHQEARWVGFEAALNMVSPRLKPVIHWASGIIAAPTGG